jgi:hypothetical protein
VEGCAENNIEVEEVVFGGGLRVILAFYSFYSLYV